MNPNAANAPFPAAHHYMLVLPDRVFYGGLLGSNMRARQMGAIALYVSPKDRFQLKVGDGEWEEKDLAIVAPNQCHRLRSDCGLILCVLIEPERLSPSVISGLMAHLSTPKQRVTRVQRIRQAATVLATHAASSDLSTAAFDRLVLDTTMSSRALDPRIEFIMNQLDQEALLGEAQASTLAASIGLSTSRFLHLFKAETDISFRKYRMWRRARSFLHYAHEDSSLTDVALQLGYPDSSHFSHSIRKTFGLKPRSIRLGSQHLLVRASSPNLMCL